MDRRKYRSKVDIRSVWHYNLESLSIHSLGICLSLSAISSSLFQNRASLSKPFRVTRELGLHSISALLLRRRNGLCRFRRWARTSPRRRGEICSFSPMWIFGRMFTLNLLILQLNGPKNCRSALDSSSISRNRNDALARLSFLSIDKFPNTEGNAPAYLRGWGSIHILRAS